MDKKEALQSYFELDECAFAEKVNFNGDCYFEMIEEHWGGQAWYIFTPEKARDCAEEAILASVWSFSPSFIYDACQEKVTLDLIHAIQRESEDGNENMLTLIKAHCGLDRFVELAIEADGMHQFIGEGEEPEEFEGYLIYDA